MAKPGSDVRQEVADLTEVVAGVLGIIADVDAKAHSAVNIASSVARDVQPWE